jgi:hypothetical protein
VVLPSQGQNFRYKLMKRLSTSPAFARHVACKYIALYKMLIYTQSPIYVTRVINQLLVN